ncbi:helix-turn-helix domain-containing protein [Lentzea chajnantorensis]
MPVLKRGETPASTEGTVKVHTIKSAAAFVRMHPKTVLKHVHEGDLKGYQRVRGGDWRIFESDLVDWLRRPKPRRRRRNA